LFSIFFEVAYLLVIVLHLFLIFIFPNLQDNAFVAHQLLWESIIFSFYHVRVLLQGHHIIHLVVGFQDAGVWAEAFVGVQLVLHSSGDLHVLHLVSRRLVGSEAESLVYGDVCAEVCYGVWQIWGR
jgi:hypothetical protein